MGKREARKEAGFQVCCHHGQLGLLLGSEENRFLPSPQVTLPLSCWLGPLMRITGCLQLERRWGAYQKLSSSGICRRDLDYHKETLGAQPATENKGCSCRSMSHTTARLRHSKSTHMTHDTYTAANLSAIVSNDLLSIVQCLLHEIKSCDLH